MPKIEKTARGYSTRVSLTDSLTGRRVQKRVSAKTLRLLNAEVARIRAEWNSGTYIEPDKTTTAQWLETWHATYRASPASRYKRGVDIRNHITNDELGRIPIVRLRYSHVQDWVDRMVLNGYAPGTIRNVSGTLSMALAQAVKRQIIASNPCTGLELPATGQRRWTVLDEDQARRMVTETRDDRLHAFWTLAVSLGIRHGELLALDWQHIDLTAGTITIERTMTREDGRRVIGDRPKREASRRTLQLPQVCLDALRRHRARQNARRLAAGEVWTDSGAVFDKGLGERMSESIVYDDWRDLKRRLNLPPATVPHDLRHTAASHMLAAGIPIPTVAKILGHSNPAVTMSVYSHSLRSLESQATERIDALFREDDERRAQEG